MAGDALRVESAGSNPAGDLAATNTLDVHVAGAADAGLRRDDVVRAVDGRPIGPVLAAAESLQSGATAQ